MKIKKKLNVNLQTVGPCLTLASLATEARVELEEWRPGLVTTSLTCR